VLKCCVSLLLAAYREVSLESIRQLLGLSAGAPISRGHAAVFGVEECGERKFVPAAEYATLHPFGSTPIAFNLLPPNFFEVRA
jgi:hypothetical protein